MATTKTNVSEHVKHTPKKYNKVPTDVVITPDENGYAAVRLRDTNFRIVVVGKDQAPPTVKRCKKCERDLPLSEFTKRRSEPDGLQRYCRECLATYQKKIDQRPEQKAKKHEYYYRRTGDGLKTVAIARRLFTDVKKKLQLEGWLS